MSTTPCTKSCSIGGACRDCQFDIFKENMQLRTENEELKAQKELVTKAFMTVNKSLMAIADTVKPKASKS